MSSKLTIALILAVLGWSCAQKPVKRHYTLMNRVNAVGAQDASPLCARSLVVESIDAVEPYDDVKVVFRTDDFEVKYFNYRVWVASPPDMLRRLVADKLTHAGIFSQVENHIDSSSDHMLLTLNLLGIEEIVKKRKHSARLAMRMQLRDPKTEELIFRYEFDKTVPFDNKTVTTLIETLNNIYNDEVDAMMPSLKNAVRNYDNCDVLAK